MAACVALWLFHAGHLYGFLGDDRTYYYRGLPVTHSWREAFRYYNTYHAYWLLVSYLPLAAKLQLPSYDLPGIENTGHFRALLLWSVFLSIGILGYWAHALLKFVERRSVALLAFWLLLVSPTFVLWTPEPESRLYGVPFMVAAMLVLFRLNRTGEGAKTPGAVARTAFWAGTLLWFGQSVNYTILYLAAPFCVVFWAAWFWRLRFGGLARAGGFGFGAGLIWLQAVLELVSYFSIGLPWSKGPLMGLVGLREIHGSHWPLPLRREFWVWAFGNQMGWPVVVLCSLGMWLYWRSRSGAEGTSRRAILLGSVVLAMVYLLFNDTMPFFRQTSVIQPFLFLFAAVAIVDVAEWAARSSYVRAGIAALLCCGASIPLLKESAEVFAAHQALGRAVTWANEHRGSRKLETLRVAWYGDSTSARTLEQLESAPADAWLLSYFPWEFLYSRPSLLPYFVETAPLVRWKSLWGTDAMRAELAAYWTDNDWRYEPVMGEARVYRIADILKARSAGALMRVRSVTASSVDSDRYEAVNIFDGDESPDGATAWISGPEPHPHTVDIVFEERRRLSGMWIVPPGAATGGGHIGSLEVQAPNASGRMSTLWAGDHLQKLSLLTPKWAPVEADRVRLVIHRHFQNSQTVPRTAMEEVGFDGYQVIPPPPARHFDEIRISSIAYDADRIVIAGSGFGRTSVFEVAGRRYPTEYQSATRLTVPPGPWPSGAEARLVDRFRRSEAFTLPKATPAGQ